MLNVVDSPDFVDWLNNEMRQRNMSQAELARLGGITRSAVNKLLNRQQKSPGREMLDAIARALRLPSETVYRAAGFLPPIPEINAELRVLNHLFMQLDEDDRQDILALIETKIRRKEDRDQAHERRSGKTDDQ